MCRLSMFIKGMTAQTSIFARFDVIKKPLIKVAFLIQCGGCVYAVYIKYSIKALSIWDNIKNHVRFLVFS